MGQDQEYPTIRYHYFASLIVPEASSSLQRQLFPAAPSHSILFTIMICQSLICESCELLVKKSLLCLKLWNTQNLVIHADPVELRNCTVGNYFELKKKAKLNHNKNKNTRTVPLLSKSEEMKTYFTTGRKCTSVYNRRVQGDNSLPEYLIVNNKQMAEPSTATQQNNISTKDSRVIMNKLHGFLSQRSALASASPPPTMSITVNGEESNASCSATFTTAGILLGCLQRVRRPGQTRDCGLDRSRGGNNFTRIKYLCNYIFLSFVYNDLRHDKLVNLKQLISHTEN